MIKRLVVLLLIAVFPCLATDYTVIENKAKVPVLTPALADSKTVKIRLNNGLEAYIVSDPNTDKSSAVLSMRTGSWEDPEEYPGIAHFLEHMLFLGTKKFPRESEYDRYITEQGGLSNAFTTNDFTSYLFAVNNTAFEEALDRFSSFFKEPLFNPSGVSRELQAIDQEFAKNIDNDDVRKVFVGKELANPNHPYHRFNIGNSSTLSPVSQATLKEWYSKHYSANLMRLMVISPLPLEKLTQLVVEDFKDVPSNDRKEVDVDLPLFSPELDNKIVYLEPIKNIRTLTLAWDLPAKFIQMQDTKPEKIVCYVLGHEGKESLLAELKREKLATALSCGNYELGPNNGEFLLEITLTDTGVQEINTVIERVFQALANFKQKGVPQYLFDEVQKLDQMRYQYQPREEAFYTMMKHAMWLPREEMSTYPEQSQIIQRFDPQAVMDLLNILTPQHSHIDLAAPSALTQVKPEHKEKWLGVAYAIRPIPQSILDTWNQATPNPKIDLPEPNPYIPKNLSLVNIYPKEQSPTPLVPHATPVIDNEGGKIYFAPDSQFLTPKISWIFEVRTPEIDIGNPMKVVLADLYIKCLNEALNESIYPATMAELNFTLTRNENGMVLEIEGYSDNASRLLSDILKQMKGWQPSQDRFKVNKEALLRDYQNAAFEPPLTQAAEMLKSILYKDFTLSKQKAAALRKVSFEKLTEYTQGLFAQVYVQGMMYGNMTEAQAKEIGEIFLSSWEGAPYPVNDQLKTEVLLLPADEGPFYVENKIEVQGNAIILAIENPTFSQKNRAAQQILMQSMDEPFFAALRTRQQTAYIVYNAGEEMERRLFDFFAVQSNTHDTRDLLARFELFIEGYLQEIHSELTPDRFEKIRTALVTNLKTPAKNVKAMGELMYHLAFKYDGDFEWIDKRIAGFNELTYDEFIKLSGEFLGRKNKRRVALMMNGILPKENGFHFTRLPCIPQLRKLSTFAPRD